MRNLFRDIIYSVVQVLEHNLNPHCRNFNIVVEKISKYIGHEHFLSMLAIRISVLV